MSARYHEVLQECGDVSLLYIASLHVLYLTDTN